MGIVKPDGDHLCKHVIRIGLRFILHQQHVDILREARGDGVRDDQRAAVVIAHGGHVIRLMQRLFAGAPQGNSGHGQHVVRRKRSFHIGKRAFVIAVDPERAFFKREGRPPLDGQGTVEIRDGDHRDGESGQRRIKGPQPEILPGEQIRVGEVGFIQRDLLHLLRIVGHVDSLCGKKLRDVGVAIHVHIGDHIQIIGGGGLGKRIHGHRSAHPHAYRTERDR